MKLATIPDRSFRANFILIFANFYLSATKEVSVYAIAQIIGVVPTAESQLRQFGVTSANNRAFRVDATFGHPDFAGNFLLYIVFTSLGAAAISKNFTRRALAVTTFAAAFVSAIFTGTRGAWCGLVVGGLIFISLIFFERRSLLDKILRKTKLKAGAALLAGALLAATLIAFTEIGGPIRSRLLAFSGEDFTGAGRTALWTMTLKMIPKYWLTGCGLEMFQVASLPFKTDEVAVLGGGMNSEEPHSAYLGLFVSTGLFPAIIYLLFIALSLKNLIRSVRYADCNGDKWLNIGIPLYSLFLDAESVCAQTMAVSASAKAKRTAAAVLKLLLSFMVCSRRKIQSIPHNLPVLPLRTQRGRKVAKNNPIDCLSSSALAY